METVSVLLAVCEGSHQSPVDCDAIHAGLWCFFDLRLNKHMSKQSRRRWFETPSRSLWCHCNILAPGSCHHQVINTHDTDSIWFAWSPSLTHWVRVTHICVSKLATIASDNGLSPGRRQAIIWTNVGILSIESLGTNISEIFIKIRAFSIKNMHLKMSSGKWQPSCLGLNVLNYGEWYKYKCIFIRLYVRVCVCIYVCIPTYIWSIPGCLQLTSFIIKERA